MADLATGLKNSSEIREIESINNATVSTPANAIKLLSRLKFLGGDLLKSSNLLNSIEDNFFDKKLDIYTVDSVITALEKIESQQKEEKKDKEEKEEEKEEIEEIEPEVEKEQKEEELVSNVDIRKLVEEYDEYIKKGLSDKEAREKIFKSYPNSNKENVDRSIKRQQEIYKETLNKIQEVQKKVEVKPVDRAAGPGFVEQKNEPVKEEVKAETVAQKIETKPIQLAQEKLARIIAEEAVIREQELTVKIGAEKAKTITNEITREIFIPQAIYKEKVDENVLNKYSTLEEIDREEITETAKVIESKILIEEKVETTTTQILEELKQDPKFQDKIEFKNVEKVENAIRQEFYAEIAGEEIIEGEIKKDLAQEIVKAVQRTEEIEIEPELITTIRTKAVAIEKQTQDWVQNNTTQFSEVRGQMLAETVQQQIFAENKNISPLQRENIQEYTRILKEIYTTPSDIDPYKKDLFIKMEASGVNRDKTQEAWTDIKGLRSVLKMSPGDFDKFVSRYKQVKQNLGDVKLPFKIKESRSLDAIVRLADNPAIKSLINRAQTYVGVFERVTRITSGRFMSGIYERIGLKIIDKIGNQAIKAFVENSAQILIKNGLEKGIGIILKGIISGGVKAVGSAAVSAGAGAAAEGAAIAVGAATGPVGWIAAAAVAVFEALKIVGGAVRKAAQNLGLELVTKQFLQETFGKVLGGGINLVMNIALAIVAIPLLIGAAIMSLVFAPIILVFTIGTFIYHLLFGSQVSSLVPPQNVGSALEAAPTRDPSIPIPEGCPSGWPISSGTITQGPNGGYSHIGLQAIDIAADGLPIHATHDGVAIPQSGIASNGVMGYQVTIIGTCQGKEFKTIYAHLPGHILSGQKTVKAGDVIGYVDNSGNSTGPHLHYQLNGLGSINDYIPKAVPEGYRNSQSSQQIYVP